MGRSGEPDHIFTWDFVWTCAANLSIFTSFYLLLAALPIYVEVIGGNETDIGLTAAVFSITAVTSRLAAGGMAYRQGTKVLMLVGGTILVVATALYLVAGTVVGIIAIRLLLGAGFGAFGTAATVLVAEIAPRARRGEAMGYFGISTNLAMAMGPAIGMLLIDALGFSWLFTVAALVGLVGVFASTAPHDHRGGAPSQAQVGLSWKRYVATSALFPSLLILCFTQTYAPIVTFVPLFAGERQLGNPGLFFAVYAVVLVLTRGPIGRLSDIWGRGAVVAPAMMAMAAAVVLLALATSQAMMLGAAALYGLSGAAMWPALQAMAVDRAAPHERNAAMGTYTMTIDFGTGFGSLVWAFVAQAAGFQGMYLWASLMGVIGLVALVVGGGLRRAPKVERVMSNE